MILDHIGLSVADARRSGAFYRAALAPLGIGPVGSGGGWTGFGRDGHNVEAVCHAPGG